MDTKKDLPALTVKFLSSIDQVSAADWNQVCGVSNPFIQHAFLSALEQTGCVNRQTGWQPHHAVTYHNDQICAVMPLYIKHHSNGEYVFDWGWAEAYHRHRINYYPKLLTAIPFTPATGPRICVSTGVDREQIIDLLIKEIKQLAETKGYSSWHLLFPHAAEAKLLADTSLSQRTGCQYHWFNQDYSSFEQFLATFTSRKRKMINRERRQVYEQGIQLTRLTGRQIGEKHIRMFYRFYQATYYKHAQQGYLNLDFFIKIVQTMTDKLLLVICYRDDEPVAGALSFIGSDTLYGRYWGCIEEYNSLHFEACYYQGIDFCIEHGLKRFDPGAQGEHKIVRGFEPVQTCSFHYIAHPVFKQAIDDFLVQERRGLSEYTEHAKTLLPFRKN